MLLPLLPEVHRWTGHPVHRALAVQAMYAVGSSFAGWRVNAPGQESRDRAIALGGCPGGHPLSSGHHATPQIAEYRMNMAIAR